jgi:hypothetical protein
MYFQYNLFNRTRGPLSKSDKYFMGSERGKSATETSNGVPPVKRRRGDRLFFRDRRLGDRFFFRDRRLGDRFFFRDRRLGDRFFFRDRRLGDRRLGDRPYFCSHLRATSG